MLKFIPEIKYGRGRWNMVMCYIRLISLSLLADLKISRDMYIKERTNYFFRKKFCEWIQYHLKVKKIFFKRNPNFLINIHVSWEIPNNFCYSLTIWNQVRVSNSKNIFDHQNTLNWSTILKKTWRHYITPLKLWNFWPKQFDPKWFIFKLFDCKI